jgi:hypothetical protein
MAFLSRRLRALRGTPRWLAAFLFLGGFVSAAQAPVAGEYQVKAVFLLNFAHFVDWPSEAFADATAPLVIGVLGNDPFTDALDETVRDEKVNNHPLAVRRYRRASEIRDCHVLFISGSESERFAEIFAQLRGRSILTVGDVESFGLAGGMIRFVTENNKTRLRINVDAAKAARLTLSSKLLRPAEIVGPGKD